jgi:hypothetical protein
MTWVDAVARRIARRRLASMRARATDPRPPQQHLLSRIVSAMARTSFGREHGIAQVRTLADLRAAVPLGDYAARKPWWERARAGERDVCWPGLVRFWALSSGTTSGEKYLPVSDATIASQKRGGFDALVPHLVEPRANLFGGKLLFLGGSTALRRHGEVWLGDNTGIMALQVPRLLRRWHAPDDRVRNMSGWEQKVAAAAAQTATTDLRMLAGVPSWIVLFGEAVLAHCRAQGRKVTTLAEVWPQLQLFVHGGVTYAPYAERVQALIGAPVRLIDTYSASEGGMLAVQDRPEDPAMLPLLDRGAVFEFVPVSELGAPNPRRLFAHEVETGVDYAVALTTDAGIVSYLVGDVVRFVSTAPLRLVFAGRVAHTLNAFGEHVSGGELERAVAAAAAVTAAIVDEFAVATDYPTPGQPMGCHRYYVQFHRAPTDSAAFARELDRVLQNGNEDYATHRSYGLRAPLVELLPAGTFLELLRRRGKIGGQHKVPRVLDERWRAELQALCAPA